jgi:hypothetical protein
VIDIGKLIEQGETEIVIHIMGYGSPPELGS